MARHAPQPSKKETKIPHHYEYSRIFKSGRMLAYAILWTLFGMIDVALLGLVSQQIHKHGGQNQFDWPGQEYGHAMGLLLASAILGLLVTVFHWAFSTGIYLVLFLILAVFNATGAGILTTTPFGMSLQCGNPVDSFPADYQPYVSDCGRVTAIVGLSWALALLAFIGLVWSFIDHFKFEVRNTKVYDIETGPTEEEKAALARSSSGTTTNTAH